MSESSPSPDAIVALNTKLEEDFVSPLTAIRGSLEILRDTADLRADEREQFITRALNECARLERGIKDLGDTVYAAARRSSPDPESRVEPNQFSDRIHLDRAQEIIDIDFSDYQFTSAKDVNEFYDAIETEIARSGRKWFFLVNNTNISIWPEAWVAFAHRGKKINVNFSLGTVRYIDANTNNLPSDVDVIVSRDLALKSITKS